ncbi:hypothetical protein PIB30_070397 [Stylosanthes scabra]|uniref:Protein FAR1-RELATED SEQUENCE n=1 Tax=Stylosanthes scabra TaxID=79078 RepID=A0ABU6SQ53_9FABA|nr:hypothetical protein [Stylosanthes scabra]
MTSRCEALNMQIGKFIHNGYNLREFAEHFQHYLEFMRMRELVAGFRSNYGVHVAKTRLEKIETYAATVYTKEVFSLFWEVLLLASNVRIVLSKRTSSSILFKDITILPLKLVLQRWTKNAKQPRVSEANLTGIDYFEVKRRIAKEREALLAKRRERIDSNVVGEEGPVRNPVRARHKGCGRRVQTAMGRFKCVQRCRNCGRARHNARRCEVGRGEDAGMNNDDV